MSTLYEEFIEKIEISLKDNIDGKIDSQLYFSWKADYYKNLFFTELDIIGGAFSVLDKYTNQPLLLFRRDRNHNVDVRDSDFFWFPYEALYYSESDAELIDKLFLTTRESQKLDKIGPDFIRYLNSNTIYNHSYLTNKLYEQNNLQVLYCDAAEIIIILFSYIIISERFYGTKSANVVWPSDSIESISLDLNVDNSEDLLLNLIKESSENELSLFEYFIKELDFNLNELNDHLVKTTLTRLKRMSNREINNVETLKEVLSEILKEKFEITHFDYYDACFLKLHNIARFPILPYLFIYLKKKKEKKVFPSHLAFPVWNSYAFQPTIRIEKKLKLEKNVIFALLTVNDKSYSEDLKIFNEMLPIVGKLGYITSDTIFYKKFTNKSIKQFALQSAVSQIFARNFAHNIGSHVAIRSTNKEIKKRLLELHPSLDLKAEPVIEWVDLMSEKLDLYEVSRNEYLAEFKLPAKNAYIYQDVILPFCENVLLMDNITRSENINFNSTGSENKLKIKVRINQIEIKAEYPLIKGSNSKPIVYPDSYPYLFEPVTTPAENKVELQNALQIRKTIGADDIEVCIPNEHAFYSILENFIRNSAKHNKERLNTIFSDVEGGKKSEYQLKYNGYKNLEALFPRSLVVNIDIDNLDGDYYTVTLYDNISLISSDDILEFQKRLETNLISKEGEIEKSNLGIADMKINAHLLASVEAISEKNLTKAVELLISTDLLDQEIPIFSQYSSLQCNLDIKLHYRFAYKFKLAKPKKIIWIGFNDASIKTQLNKKGIVTLNTMADFSLANTSSLSSFDFAIIEKNVIETIPENYDWDNLLIKMPFRIILNCKRELVEDCSIKELVTNGKLVCNDGEELVITNVFDEKFDEIFQLSCWKTWFTRWGIDENNKAALIICQEEKPDWLEFENDQNILEFPFFNVIYTTTQKNCPPSYNFKTNAKYLECAKIVMYDQHGSGFMGIFNEQEIQKSKVEFYSILEKGNLDQLLIQDKHPKDLGQLFYCKLIEASLLKILVIDERLIEVALDKGINKGGIQSLSKKIFKKALTGNFINQRNYVSHYLSNIIYATHFFGAEIVKSKTLNSKILAAADNKIAIDYKDVLIKGENHEALFSEYVNRFDLIILHRTYLDDSYLNQENKAEVLRRLKNSCLNVLITSGGGRPHNLGDLNYKYSPLSQIMNKFGKQISKFALIQNLQINETTYNIE
jgi:hypothetical protein